MFKKISKILLFYLQLEANRRNLRRKNLFAQKELEMEILLILQHVGGSIR
jgi:hypothetical protein